MVRNLVKPKNLEAIAQNFSDIYNLIWIESRASIEELENDDSTEKFKASCIMHNFLTIAMPNRFSKIYRNKELLFKNPQEVIEFFQSWYYQVHRLYIYNRVIQDPNIDLSTITKEDLDSIDKTCEDTFKISIKIKKYPIFYERAFRRYRSEELMQDWLEQIEDIDFNDLIEKIIMIENGEEYPKEDEDHPSFKVNDQNFDPTHILHERLQIMLNDGLVITSFDIDDHDMNHILIQAQIYVPDYNNSIYRRENTFYKSPDEFVDFFKECYSTIQMIKTSKEFSQLFGFLDKNNKYELLDGIIRNVNHKVSYEFSRVNTIPKDKKYAILKVTTREFINQLFL